MSQLIREGSHAMRILESFMPMVQAAQIPRLTPLKILEKYIR
jgi:hypothetical protein